MPVTNEPERPKIPSWVWPLLVLIVTGLIFWVLPERLKDRPVDVEFSSK